jgi:putative sterol carrier protein
MTFGNEPLAKGELARERGKIQNLARQNLEILADKIRLGQEVGAFRAAVDPMAAATALWASYNGIYFAALNPALLDLAQLSVEELLSAAAFMHFTGLGADPALGPRPVKSARGDAPTSVSVSDVQEVMRSVPWIDPAVIFSGMPMAFRAERAAGVSEVYRFVVTGDRGGMWTVVVEEGEMRVSKGATREPSVTIEISDRRFVELTTGEAKGIELIVNGEMKITGDLQRAAMFQTFFLPAEPRRG